jgi:hypothetical protein
VLLFTARTFGGFENAQIATLDLKSGVRKNLVRGGVHGRYVSTGHLVFAKGTTLMAAPFDLGRVEVLGSPIAILEGVRYHAIGGVADYSISDTGTLAYAAAFAKPGELVRVSRDGLVRNITNESLSYREVRVSPNGREIAVTSEVGDQTDLWIVDAERGTTRLLTHGYRNETPVWSPDGRRIIFSSNRNGPTSLFWLPTDRSEDPRSIKTAQQWTFATSVTPDGQAVLYGAVDDTGWDIWIQSFAGSTPARKLLGTRAHERHARLSPDARILAFMSDGSGRNEVYVVSCPELNQPIRVSTTGGSQPVWAQSGHELFFLHDHAVMTARVETSPRLTVGVPEVLLNSQFRTASIYASTYDVSPGAQSFVMIRPTEGADAGGVKYRTQLVSSRGTAPESSDK